jgi:hypothetical protein
MRTQSTRHWAITVGAIVFFALLAFAAPSIVATIVASLCDLGQPRFSPDSQCLLAYSDAQVQILLAYRSVGEGLAGDLNWVAPLLITVSLFACGLLFVEQAIFQRQRWARWTRDLASRLASVSAAVLVWIALVIMMAEATSEPIHFQRSYAAGLAAVLGVGLAAFVARFFVGNIEDRIEELRRLSEAHRITVVNAASLRIPWTAVGLAGVLLVVEAIVFLRLAFPPVPAVEEAGLHAAYFAIIAVVAATGGTMVTSIGAGILAVSVLASPLNAQRRKRWSVKQFLVVPIVLGVFASSLLLTSLLPAASEALPSGWLVLAGTAILLAATSGSLFLVLRFRGNHLALWASVALAPVVVWLIGFSRILFARIRRRGIAKAAAMSDWLAARSSED